MISRMRRMTFEQFRVNKKKPSIASGNMLKKSLVFQAIRAASKNESLRKD